MRWDIDCTEWDIAPKSNGIMPDMGWDRGSLEFVAHDFFTPYLCIAFRKNSDCQTANICLYRDAELITKIKNKVMKRIKTIPISNTDIIYRRGGRLLY